VDAQRIEVTFGAIGIHLSHEVIRLNDGGGTRRHPARYHEVTRFSLMDGRVGGLQQCRIVGGIRIYPETVLVLFVPDLEGGHTKRRVVGGRSGSKGRETTGTARRTPRLAGTRRRLSP